MNPAMVYIKIPHPCMGKNICKSEEFSLAKNIFACMNLKKLAKWKKLNPDMNPILQFLIEFLPVFREKSLMYLEKTVMA